MTANETQIGGTHYKDMAVQPWDYMRECMSAEAFTGYLQGCCIKYLSRFHKKGGVEDLRKARHYLDKLIETLDPPFAVTLDKSIRDSLLDKYKDGVPAGEAWPHAATMPTWGICDAAGNPISWPPSGVTFSATSPEIDAAKRASAEAENTRDNTSPAIMTFADGGVVGIEAWSGPDWSQAPEWAMWWAVDPQANGRTGSTAHWLFKEPKAVETDDLNYWSLVSYGNKSADTAFQGAPLFGYTGDWRDSLRTRPQ